jgi:serine protease AprX
MKFYQLLLFFLLTVSLFAQDKYFIYLKDKGVPVENRIEKTNPVYIAALKKLTDRCIQRRIKNLGEENIISYEDIPIKSEYISAVENLGVKIENKLNWFNAVSAYLSQEQVKQIENYEFVDKIVPVRTLKFKDKTLPVADSFNKQTADRYPLNYGPSYDQLQLSDIPIVHSKGITGKGVLIGILDTGFDWSGHESLMNSKVVAEYDFINKDSITSDQSSDLAGQQNHGTLVFSIVGGFKDSSMIGASFGSQFILAKTEDIRSETHIEEDNYAAALEWMENLGVDITTSSLGYSIFDASTYSYSYSDMDGKSTIVTIAAEIAFRKGVLTITAAGNEGNTSWHYIIAPADGTYTIAVGAVDDSNNVASFSSRGPTYDVRIKPDIVARGVRVYGAKAGSFNGYTAASGTSVSTPIACGVASLLLSEYPYLKNTQIRKILFETSDNNSSLNNDRGYGLVSALHSIEYPNLEYTQGMYILHKKFITKENIIPSSVTVHYSVNGLKFPDLSMSLLDDYIFTSKFAYLNNDDEVEFYFTYSDSKNNSSREPVSNNYKFLYGQLDISLNLPVENKFTDYVASNVYPNPFLPAIQGFTRLTVKSSGDEKFRVVMIDASGQQVIAYETTTIEGENHFDWNGLSNLGINCASGVYYYLIHLGDRNFGRKMILLR